MKFKKPRSHNKLKLSKIRNKAVSRRLIAQSKQKEEELREDFIKTKAQMLKDVEFDYQMEEENDFEAKKVIRKTQNIDQHLGNEKFEQWVEFNNANKKLLSYKIQNMRKNFSKEFNLIVSNYLKARKI